MPHPANAGGPLGLPALLYTSSGLAALQFKLAPVRFKLLLERHGNADQPRQPAGSLEGDVATGGRCSGPGGSFGEGHDPAGDLSRFHEWARRLHSDLNPSGLYIPFRDAGPAVKEFLETAGDLPKGITRIAFDDLPEKPSPDPRDPNIAAINDRSDGSGSLGPWGQTHAPAPATMTIALPV